MTASSWNLGASRARPHHKCSSLMSLLPPITLCSTIISKLHRPLFVPDHSRTRPLSHVDWAKRGRNLAALAPTHFTLPPDTTLEVLSNATQMYQAEVPARHTQALPHDDEVMVELKAVIGNLAFWWLKDTGANFTVVTTKLSKQLGLKVLPYDGKQHW